MKSKDKIFTQIKGRTRGFCQKPNQTPGNQQIQQENHTNFEKESFVRRNFRSGEAIEMKKMGLKGKGEVG